MTGIGADGMCQKTRARASDDPRCCLACVEVGGVKIGRVCDAIKRPSVQIMNYEISRNVVDWMSIINLHVCPSLTDHEPQVQQT